MGVRGDDGGGDSSCSDTSYTSNDNNHDSSYSDNHHSSYSDNHDSYSSHTNHHDYSTGHHSNHNHHGGGASHSHHVHPCDTIAEELILLYAMMSNTSHYSSNNADYTTKTKRFEEASKSIKSAKASYEKNDYTSAKDSLSKALKVKSEDHEVIHYLAKIAVKENSFLAAVGYYAQIENTKYARAHADVGSEINSISNAFYEKAMDRSHYRTIEALDTVSQCNEDLASIDAGIQLARLAAKLTTADNAPLVSALLSTFRDKKTSVENRKAYLEAVQKIALFDANASGFIAIDLEKHEDLTGLIKKMNELSATHQAISNSLQLLHPKRDAVKIALSGLMARNNQLEKQILLAKEQILIRDTKALLTEMPPTSKMNMTSRDSWIEKLQKQSDLLGKDKNTKDQLEELVKSKPEQAVMAVLKYNVDLQIAILAQESFQAKVNYIALTACGISVKDYIVTKEDAQTISEKIETALKDETKPEVSEAVKQLNRHDLDRYSTSIAGQLRGMYSSPVKTIFFSNVKFGFNPAFNQQATQAIQKAVLKK